MAKSLFDLTGEVALMVGGGGGIGSAGCRGLADLGAYIVVADKSFENARRVAAGLEKANHKAMAVSVDITSMDDVEKMVEKTLKEFGKIDILANFAATTARKPIMELSYEEWTNIIDVNLTAAFRLSKAVGPEMIKRKKGKVVHISSSGGLRASANFSAYGASKAGLIHLVKTLALEWAPYNIRVNSIAPFATETPFTAEYYRQNPEKKEATKNANPLKRLGQPEDYVGALQYLCSAASDYVNGIVLSVDGGITV